MKLRGALLGFSCGLLLNGCCITPPAAAKYFTRESCRETLKGFVYAVDVHEWDYAYESLTASSREEIGSALRFQVAVRYLKDPVWRDISLYKLISESVPHFGPEVGEGSRRFIGVRPRVKDEKGHITFFDVKLYFLLENEEWRLDLLESVRSLQESAPAAPPDITRQ